MTLKFLVDFLLALAPGVAWVLYIRRRDRYDPEPGSLLARAFLSGLLLVPIARILERAMTPAGCFGIPPLPLWVHLAFVVAPLEELLKFAVTRIWFYPHPEFNEPVDGIVYASVVGIGFASMENSLYMLRDGATVGLIRSGVSTLLHLGCAGLVGHALGQQKFAPKRARVFLAVLGAVAVHGTFDVLTSCAPAAQALSMTALAIIMLLSLLLGLYTVLDEEIRADLKISPFRKRYLRQRRARHAKRDSGAGTEV
jgi:RsiW-degrading membrane proteinase PrsW (M82 family)